MAVVGLLAVLAGCGSDGTAGSDTGPATTTAGSSPMSTPTPESTPTEPSGTFTTGAPSTPGSVPEGLQSAVDIAVADLAGRLGVDPSTIVTVSARDVTWPDSSAGCPQPGMMYTQVQVDGAEIILESAGISYRYTLGGTRGAALCENA